MRRSLLAVAAVTAATHLLTLAPHAGAQGGQWGNLRGRIVWDGETLPETKWLPIPKRMAGLLVNNPAFDMDRMALKDNALIVQRRNKGIKNVFVYLMDNPGGPALPLHRHKVQPPRDPVVIDMTDGVFQPRCVIMREGQTVVFRNKSADTFAVRWDGFGDNNPGGAVSLPSNVEWELKNLKAQRLQVCLSCLLHNWMRGRVAVLAHPYAALTDDSGCFEIKGAPAGEWNVMIHHEEIGYRLGAKGKNGEPVRIKANDVTDLGDLPMGK